MKFFLFTLITACCLNSYSQIGATVGLTNTSNEFYDDRDFSLGYTGSVFARLNLGPFAFRPELGFYQSKLAYSWVAPNGTLNSKSSITSNNLHLGNSFEIFLGPAGVHFGSSLGVIMSQTSRVTIDGNANTVTINFDDIDILDRAALLGHLGVTINITKNFFTELRYNTTLALGANDFDFDVDYRTSMITISIGLSL